jgi:hypothetical protein
MERQPVESSSLRSVGYDAQRRELAIEFHDGTVYLYGNVPEDVYAALLQSESKGGYFNAEIREQYVYHKVEDRESDQKPKDSDESLKDNNGSESYD